MKNHRLLKISLITLSALIPLLMTSCKKEPNTAPVAKFTISPSYGTTATVFSFDASGVTDLEDPIELLSVRWDWESDSVFDTEFSTTKIIERQFAKGGTYYVSLEVKDSGGKTSRYTDFVKVNWSNRPPKAALNITPPRGFLQDIFRMDASAVSDAEDKATDLMVRFDFNGDGTFDTEYSKTKVATHQYTLAGVYAVKLEVKDSGGSLDDQVFSLTVGGMNQPSEAPKDPAPADQAGAVTTRANLSWTCIDPDADSMKYDIYLGRDSNPGLVASDVTTAQYATLPLEFGKTYYWKVVAKDPYQHVVAGPVWSFETHTPIYEMGSFTDARDGKVYKTVKINDKIWMAQNLNIGTMIHASTGGKFGDGYQRDSTRAEKYCYRNEAVYCDLYGGLYQWDKAMNFTTVEGTTGICPVGWHLPTDAEWMELIVFLQPKEGEKLAGDDLVWGSKSGFEGLFSGYLIFAERKYYDADQAGYFWSSTLNPQINHLALGRSVFRSKSAFQQDTFQRVSGLPVRCLKDY
jgi:uncharacterized protein (TIGR02145 family)